MCLIAFALRPETSCPLLVAANRDEHFDRPTQALHLWTLPGGTPVAAGRDLSAGGTWLGVTPAGRVAMLTNVREAQAHSGPHSRGELVTAWLQGRENWTSFAAQLQAGRYSGFNLVVGDLLQGGWAWITNRPTEATQTEPRPSEPAPGLWARGLTPGVYGLSNAGLDTPWPKTVRLTQAMHAVVDQLPGEDARPALPPNWRSTLLSGLLDRRPAPWESLPRTGAPMAWEHALSSPFVDYTERRYGTRSSLLLHTLGNEVTLEEWTHERPAAAPAPASSPWPLSQSHYRRMCISMCGMPASSNGSPLTV